MDSFEGLKKFNLLEHGDVYEKMWWSSLANDFPEYEEFWRWNVVPLTNRIVLPYGHPEWIYFREGVPPRFRRVAMAHYSVFYFMARSMHQSRREDGLEFVEDNYYHLDSCVDNVEWFFEWSCKLFRDFGVPERGIPQQMPGEASDTEVGAIRQYRNAFIHHPVLLRRVSEKGVELPARRALVRVLEDWEEGRRFEPDEWVEAKVLLAELRAGLLEFVRPLWKIIGDRMGNVRNAKKYLDRLSLRPHLPIVGPELQTVAQPIATSGRTLDRSTTKNGFLSTPASGFVPPEKLEDDSDGEE